MVAKALIKGNCLSLKAKQKVRAELKAVVNRRICTCEGWKRRQGTTTEIWDPSDPAAPCSFHIYEV